MSTKDKHTGGPWAVEYDGTTVVMGGQCVIVAPAKDGSTREEEKANAALIAAAPCLLAALELIVPDMQHYVSTHGSGPDKRLDVAYAAIERARQ
tara:strand:+ start:497 stop:778 length:282 start_codon:yes stop_codon:yes gene_type:complete